MFFNIYSALNGKKSTNLLLYDYVFGGFMFRRNLNIFYKITILQVIFLIIVCFVFSGVKPVFAMPFYNLEPKDIVFRAEFSTDYSKSQEERKHNIKLAAKSIDKCLIDVGGEFSFNKTVGARTEKRGYKSAKIIVKGEFVEGVGGGVCQVSTTLYNAALLSGLKITESHPHSLSVNYVSLSFDAMVNSGSADLRFINTTKNPLIIRAFADGSTLKIKIYGEKMQEKYFRKTVIKEELIPEYSVIEDALGEYPDLYVGETKILSYGKKGYISEGYLYKTVNGKTTGVRIRRDKYLPINGTKIAGTTFPPVITDFTDVAEDNAG